MWKFDHQPLARLPDRRSLLPLLAVLAVVCAALRFSAATPVATITATAASPVLTSLESDVAGLPAVALRLWFFLPAFLPHDS